MEKQATMKEGDKVTMHGQEWEVISAYSREQAFEDGVLVDVTETAREAGWKFPVALTRAVWNECVEVPPKVKGQDEMGRLWDIVYMSVMSVRAAKKKGKSGSTLLFMLYVRNDNRKPKPVTLKLIVGPGDNLEPVVTILLPDED